MLTTAVLKLKPSSSQISLLAVFAAAPVSVTHTPSQPSSVNTSTLPSYIVGIGWVKRNLEHVTLILELLVLCPTLDGSFMPALLQERLRMFCAGVDVGFVQAPFFHSWRKPLVLLHWLFTLTSLIVSSQVSSTYSLKVPKSSLDSFGLFMLLRRASSRLFSC